MATDEQAVREAAILRLVRSAYESPGIVYRYASVGLWPSEESLVLDYFPENARVLDLGCGAGRATVALAEMGLPTLGIDISELMIDVAREQALQAGVAETTQFSVMDSRQLEGVPDGSFDAALYSYNGLELVPGFAGKRRVLAEVHRVLRPGGRFVLCTHSMFAINRYAPTRMLAFARFLLGQFGLPVRERELGERFIDDELEEARYLQIMPPLILRRLLRQAGFRVIYYNTRARIEARRSPRPWAVFADGERFFVAEKTGEILDPADT
jgi:ubiquinone/menaquinone biosynthesis C-methylase UbiE